MTWFAVDDQLPRHRKVVALKRGGHFESAMTVWLLAGAWACSDRYAKETGEVPLDLIADLQVRDWELAIKELDRVGLVLINEAEDVMVFHDWADWNGLAAPTRRLEARREADRMRQQNRRSMGWSRDQVVTNPGQSSDHPVTPGKGDGFGSLGNSSKEQTSSPGGKTRKGKRGRHVKPVREDAVRLCEHLADRIVANGSKRPNITLRWIDEARRLMDIDGRTEEQIHSAAGRRAGLRPGTRSGLWSLRRRHHPRRPHHHRPTRHRPGRVPGRPRLPVRPPTPGA